MADPNDLVTEHLDVVTRVVNETMGRVPRHVSRDDLTSAGLTALLLASKAFDPERGVPFPRYAETRVRGAILDELRSVDWATRSVRRRARDLDAVRNRLCLELGRPPSTEEVAAAAGIAVAEVAANEHDVARAQVRSLHALRETCPEDLLPASGPDPEQQVVRREQLEYLADAIAELPERLRLVVHETFLAERPAAEVAERLGVSESRVSQLRTQALELLRDALHHELDPALLAPHPRPGGTAARRREAYFDAVAQRHAALRRVS